MVSTKFGSFGQCPKNYLYVYIHTYSTQGVQRRLRPVSSAVLRVLADHDGRAHTAWLRQHGALLASYTLRPNANRRAQFFGLFGLSNRASSMIGPNVIQAIIDNTGDNWKGFPFLFALCFCASFVIWFFVDVTEGRRAAVRWAEERRAAVRAAAEDTHDAVLDSKSL